MTPFAPPAWEAFLAGRWLPVREWLFLRARWYGISQAGGQPFFWLDRPAGGGTLPV